MNGTNYEVPHCGAFSTPHSHPSWAQIFALLLLLLYYYYYIIIIIIIIILIIIIIIIIIKYGKDQRKGKDVEEDKRKRNVEDKMFGIKLNKTCLLSEP